MYDVEKIRASIPKDCPIDMVHVLLHINNGVGERDPEQKFHDLELAGRLLIVLTWDERDKVKAIPHGAGAGAAKTN